FFAEDLLIPVGPFRSNDDGVAVWRNFYRREAHRVEKLIDGELGLCGLALGKDRSGKDRGENRRHKGDKQYFSLPGRWVHGIFDNSIQERGIHCTRRCSQRARRSVATCKFTFQSQFTGLCHTERSEG